MSQSDNAQKYEYLNAISTEQLRELLELEISSDRDNDELVLHILGVIKERNKQNGEASNVTWQQARADFDEYYNTPDGKGRSLYPTDIGPKKVPTKKSPGKVVRWIATVAAVLVLVVFVVPPALGDADVWDMVARWTDNIFQVNHVSSTADIIDPIQAEVVLNYSNIHDAFSTYQIKEKLIPTQFPSGYVFDSISIHEHPSKGEILFYVTFYKDITPLYFSVIKRQSIETRVYEKSDHFIEVYDVNEVEHFIFSNNNVITTMWTNKNYECSLTATVSLNEMKSMINSIYE